MGLRGWFKRAGRTPVASAGSTEGRLVYAIGDIHGRVDLLDGLLAAIEQDWSSQRYIDRPVIVFLGDYVDRGADSRAVVDRIITLKARRDVEVITLLGNHEDVLLLFLDDAQVGAPWAEHGGLATLASYGVMAPSMRTDDEKWKDVHARFRANLPVQHKEFFGQLDLAYYLGSYFFVHAGVRPNVPLAEQSRTDMLWIRSEFLESQTKAELTIVHGHTPEEEPHFDERRIGLDTGAYATGTLTAACLLDERRGVIQFNQGFGSRVHALV